MTIFVSDSYIFYSSQKMILAFRLYEKTQNDPIMTFEWYLRRRHCMDIYYHYCSYWTITDLYYLNYTTIIERNQQKKQLQVLGLSCNSIQLHM